MRLPATDHWILNMHPVDHRTATGDASSALIEAARKALDAGNHARALPFLRALGLPPENIADCADSAGGWRLSVVGEVSLSAVPTGDRGPSQVLRRNDRESVGRLMAHGALSDTIGP